MTTEFSSAVSRPPSDGGRDGLRVNLVALLKLSVAVDAAFLQYGFIGDYPVFSENVHQTFYDFFPCE